MREKANLQMRLENPPDIFGQGVETLPQLLIHQARRIGDEVFCRKKHFGVWQPYTWNDVLEHVKSFAMGLVSLGVKRGDTVALIGENQPELFWSEYAAQAIGAKVVCLYSDLTPSQMEYVLVHSDATTVVCEDQEQIDKVLKLENGIPAIHAIIYWNDRGMWEYNDPKLFGFQQVQERGREYVRQYADSFEKAVNAGKGTDTAILSYTAGTTGLPKGCIITHENLFDMAFRLTNAISLKPFTEYLPYNSLAWGLEQIFGIAIGLFLPFVLNFPEEPETIVEDLREIGIESLVLTSRQWESLASMVDSKMIYAGAIRRWFYKCGMAVGRKNNLALLEARRVPLAWRLIYPLAEKAVLSPLKYNLGLQAACLAISGGAGMAPDVLRFFHSIGVRLRSSYGTTEIGPVAVHDEGTGGVETLGKWLISHTRFGPPLEYKVTGDGELLIRGGSGFAGYYKEQKTLPTKIDGGWFHSGDVVKVTDKNELVYIDRLEDMQPLSTGHFWAPQLTENRLRFSTFVKDAVTILDQDKLFVAALISINAATVGRWAMHRKMRYTTFTDLSQNSAVRELIRIEIEKINDFLPKESKIKRFINLPKELDPDEDELTQTRKLRRRFLQEKYATFISAIYNGESEFKAEVPIKYRDGRSGVLATIVYINDLVQE